VRLSSGKMSSRTGEVIVALDFIAEIADAAQARIKEANPELVEDRELAESMALAAIKYSTLKGNILQDSVFDKEQALSFEGASGPYLQYTYARIQSVLRKAADVGMASALVRTPAQAYTIERLVYRFEAITKEAVVERAPHKVAQYLTELAGSFNTFYAQEKIADPDDEFAPYKLALTTAVGHTLKNGLWLLAIKAPERM
ncbi:MAG: arginine--tRNA ligase, partial [Bacteroidota bacterium]